MLKRIVTAIAALTVASPSMAAPSQLDEQHTRLWQTLENAGVEVYLNPKEVCNRNPAPMGLYVHNARIGRTLMGICQDNRKPDGKEVEWTANDLDTLRHESMHFLQDCLDGTIDSRLSPYFDGDGPSPSVLTYQDVIKKLGWVRAARIAELYRSRGASDLTIQLEQEAFAVAAYASADQISDKIYRVCPIR